MSLSTSRTSTVPYCWLNDSTQAANSWCWQSDFYTVPLATDESPLSIVHMMHWPTKMSDAPSAKHRVYPSLMERSRPAQTRSRHQSLRRSCGKESRADPEDEWRMLASDSHNVRCGTVIAPTEHSWTAVKSVCWKLLTELCSAGVPPQREYSPEVPNKSRLCKLYKATSACRSRSSVRLTRHRQQQALCATPFALRSPESLKHSTSGRQRLLHRTPRSRRLEKMCKLHYASHSCGDTVWYKITHCKQHTDCLVRNKGVGCMDRTRVYDKIDEHFCQECTYKETLKLCPWAMPPRPTPLEKAYDDDANPAG